MKHAIYMILISFVILGCSSKNLSQEVYSHDKIYSSYNVVYPKDTNLTKAYEALKSNIDKKMNELKFTNGDEFTIKVKILSFKEGNRALRYFVGFGAGSAKTLIETKYYDKSDNLLGKLKTKSSLSMGIFGGDSNEILNLVAEKIVNFAKENYLIEK